MLTSRFTFAVALSIAVLTARANAATLSLSSDNIQLGVSDGATFITNQPLVFGPLVTGNFQYNLFPEPGDPPPFSSPLPRLFVATSAVISPAQGGSVIDLNASPNLGFFSNYTTPGSAAQITPTFGTNFAFLGFGTYTLSFSTFLGGSVGTPVPVNGSITITKSVTFTVAAVPEPSPLPGILLLAGTFIVVVQRQRKLNQA